MSLITLIIAGVVLAGTVILAFSLPHPITWLMAIVWGAVFFAILLPKYQGEQQALAGGEEITARVDEVRFWSRRYGDGQFLDQYEIIALWDDPRSGKTVRFVSAPLQINPEPYLSTRTVKVKVNPANPQQYVMDLSFMPKPQSN
ncbi:MAG: hypothetical protein Q4G42_06195 [Neisseria sp.]|nr:hypothetical protein [Neisseria sp.]